MNYNHPRWPSPRARIVANHMNLGRDIKRMTHQQALELLSKKAKKTIPEFLEMPEEQAWLALGSYRESYGWSHLPTHIPINPLSRIWW